MSYQHLDVYEDGMGLSNSDSETAPIYMENSRLHDVDKEINADEKYPLFPSASEFAEQQRHGSINKLFRTGRQRKKLAARTKGGEFMAKRRKRRGKYEYLVFDLYITNSSSSIQFLSAVLAAMSTFKSFTNIC